MNNLQSPQFDATCDSYRYLREGVLLWDAPPSQMEAPYEARFVTQDGVYPVTSCIDPPMFGDPDVVDKVCAVILSLPNHQMYVMSVQREDAIDPIEVMSPGLCPVPSVLVDVYELLHAIATPVLRRFGARIGRRTWIGTTFLTEFDLVEVGDDAEIGMNVSLQSHLFEDRVMKMSRVNIGPGASIGTRTVVLYDTVVGADVRLGALSLVMKGERLTSGTDWQGLPA